MKNTPSISSIIAPEYLVDYNSRKKSKVKYANLPSAILKTNN